MSIRSVAIIDYSLGNVQSVCGAVEKLGHRPVVTDNFQQLESADCLILPGVGAFKDGMNELVERGLIPFLNDLVLVRHKPILGICLGAQLFCKEGHEFGRHDGLGWLNAKVQHLDLVDLPVPHVGWDDLVRVKDSYLYTNISDSELFYYAHSYFIDPADPSEVVGQCCYGKDFAALLEKGNIVAAQFHPEKSQIQGLALLNNFIEYSCQNGS